VRAPSQRAAIEQIMKVSAADGAPQITLARSQ
jgi:hypothetical protein